MRKKARPEADKRTVPSDASTVNQESRNETTPGEGGAGLGASTTAKSSLSVTALASSTTLRCVSPRTRPQPRNVNWDDLAPEVRATLEAGIDEAERGEFADLTAEETEHYLQTGELPERVERWLDSYDSRQGT